MRRRVLQAALIALVIAATALCLFAYFESEFVARPEAFSSSTWKQRSDLATEIDPGCVRGGMAESLVHSEALMNLSEASVQAMLGEPARRGNRSSYYPLGQCHGFGFSHSELVVSYSSSGTVQRTELRPTPH